MGSTYTNLLYHIIFSTKHRQPLIHKSFQKQLYKYMGGVIRNMGGILLEIGGISDHVHLAVSFKANKSVSEMLRGIKANSSKWINENTDPDFRFQWQDGFAALSVSESHLNRLKQYIRNQEHHHKNKTLIKKLEF